jgi:integrase
MTDETAITIYTGGIVPYQELPRYDDDLARAAQVADELSKEDAFKEYHATCSDNSRRAQHDALALFSTYLAEAGVTRSADDLYSDAEAWRGMSHGLLKGFRAWLLKQGYRVSTVNHRLAIVRQYCRLAKDAGVIDEDGLDLIMTVKGYAPKHARNIDKDREREGQKTSRSTKKATPATVHKAQAHRLKRETIHPARPYRRKHDELLEARDALMMGLFIEHAFRVSEVAGINVENFDLERGTVTVYRSKTNQTDTHNLEKHTMLAADRYLALIGRKTGPLFVSYQGKRITRYGLYGRVRQLGRQVGIENLSPHDLRHYWTFDALGNKTPIDKVKAGGGWKSASMVLRYAERVGIANEGVIISE